MDYSNRDLDVTVRTEDWSGEDFRVVQKGDQLTFTWSNGSMSDPVTLKVLPKVDEILSVAAFQDGRKLCEALRFTGASEWVVHMGGTSRENSDPALAVAQALRVLG